MLHRIVQVLLALALTLGCSAQEASADTVYKWVDANGTVHFGARPPADVDAQPVDVQAPPAPPPEGTGPYAQRPSAQEEMAASRERRQERIASRSEAEAAQAELDAACETMRAQVAILEPRTNVLMRQADGTVVRMDDKDRLRALKDAKRFIRENCQ